MTKPNKKACSRISGLTSAMLENRRVLEIMYNSIKETEGTEKEVDYSTITELEIQNRLIKDELNDLITK